MIRILIRAGSIGAVTALALDRLEGGQQVLIWELVLIVVVVLEMRRLPEVEAPADRSLFDVSRRDPVFLPRAVSTTELTAVDALSGHLGPNRRLQPTLRRIAAHRLRARGIDIDTSFGAEALGDSAWSWLNRPTESAPDIDLLESVISRMEGL